MDVLCNSFLCKEIIQYLDFNEIIKLRICKNLLTLPCRIDFGKLKKCIGYSRFFNNYHEINPTIMRIISYLSRFGIYCGTMNLLKNNDVQAIQIIANLIISDKWFPPSSVAKSYRHKIDRLICMAVECNSYEAVKYLLSIDHSPNICTKTLMPFGRKRPIFISSFNGNYEITKLLLDHKADPNPEKLNPPTTNPLFEAIKKNHYNIVNLLLDYKCDPNAYGDQYNGEEIPLFVAVSCGNIDLTDLLLNRGGNGNYITIKKHWGSNSILRLAYIKKNQYMIDYLINRGFRIQS